MQARAVPERAESTPTVCKFLILLVIGLLPLELASAVSAQQYIARSVFCRDADLNYEQHSFTSGGKSINVEQYRPKGAAKYPAIIMIHGSGGLLTRRGTEMPVADNFGEKRIACGGYLVLLVHFFDRSGILSTVDKQYMEQQSVAWLETLGHAVDYASSLPNVSPSRIGLFGESLGGYLALSLAMRDVRIKAVSEYGGGIRLRDGDNPRRLPPVLIQHSGADSIVPVAEAWRLDKVLSEANVMHRLKIYEGLNHYPNNKVRGEIEEQSLQFFDEHLTNR